MFRLVAFTALLATPTALLAQAKSDTQRIRSVTLTGNDRCPPSTATDIVVCTRVKDPYRIPAELRDAGPIPPQNQSWVNRTAALEETQRKAGGIPDTCTPVGTGGQTGCWKDTTKAYSAGVAEAYRAKSVPSPSAGADDEGNAAGQ